MLAVVCGGGAGVVVVMCAEDEAAAAALLPPPPRRSNISVVFTVRLVREKQEIQITKRKVRKEGEQQRQRAV